MPFWILVPMMWDELTLPYMSASTIPLIARQPKRRMISGMVADFLRAQDHSRPVVGQTAGELVVRL